MPEGEGVLAFEGNLTFSVDGCRLGFLTPEILLPELVSLGLENLRAEKLRSPGSERLLSKDLLTEITGDILYTSFADANSWVKFLTLLFSDLSDIRSSSIYTIIIINTY